ncbi:hypothetical protein [Paenibacillus sp. sgz302251]|uniref:hypothetical protein n=1 Tax=Paenibacillus sp. sgz302251 TaxID=3414493 RepID=UPI003C79B537
MINLLQYIFDTLKAIHPKVFLETVPNGSVFPYITYSLPTSGGSEYREDFILEIDIWDNKPLDTTELETITNNIDKAMNRTYEINDEFQCSIYRINRLMLPDQDVNIRRRQLRYQVKYYNKQQ